MNTIGCRIRLHPTYFLITIIQYKPSKSPLIDKEPTNLIMKRRIGNWGIIKEEPMPRVISSLFHKDGRTVQPFAGLRGRCLQCSSILGLKEEESATPFTQERGKQSLVANSVQLELAGWWTQCPVCGGRAEFTMPITSVEVAADPQDRYGPSRSGGRETYLLTWSGAPGYDLNLEDPSQRQRRERARAAIRKLKQVTTMNFESENSFSVETAPLADYTELSRLVLSIAVTFARQMQFFQIQIHLESEIRHQHSEQFEVTYPWD